MTDTVSAASETVTLTLSLPRDLMERLQSLAAGGQWDLATHVAEALTDYIPWQERRRAKIQSAIEELDAGAPTYSNEEVMAWVESWGTENELPAPDERDRPG
jgi:predicted transcriptional regulator